MDGLRWEKAAGIVKGSVGGGAACFSEAGALKGAPGGGSGWWLEVWLEPGSSKRWRFGGRENTELSIRESRRCLVGWKGFLFSM